MNSNRASSSDVEAVDRLPSSELEERLSGNWDSLSDFAQELSRLNGPREIKRQNASERAAIPGRINADEDNPEQGLAKLVLIVIELLRQLMERQAVRRIEAGSLSDEEIERMGETFLKLDQKMNELKETFGLTDEDLKLNLGPLGDLL